MKAVNTVIGFLAILILLVGDNKEKPNSDTVSFSISNKERKRKGPVAST